MRHLLIIAVPLLALSGFASPSARADDGSGLWQGLYIGGHAGWAHAWHKVENPTDGTGNLFDGTDANPTPFTFDGFLAGGTIGYNFGVWDTGLLNGVLFGVEADFGYLGVSEATTSAPTADAGNYVKASYGFYGDGTVRLGKVIDNFLIYGKGGIALAEIRNEACDLDLPGPACDPGDITDVTKTRLGYAVGGGIEFAFMTGLSAKVEYLYMDFSPFRGSNADGNFITNKNHVHTVKVGINVDLDTVFDGR